MDRLEATELLDLWERGLTQSGPRRMAALLRAAWPDASGDVLNWPLGLRDARLLALRRRLFGSDLTLVSPCPSCGEAVESTFRVDDVLLADEARSETVRPAGGTIARDGYTVAFQLPTIGDVVAIAEAAAVTPASARERLLNRCVVDVRRADGTAADLTAVSGGVITDIVNSMAAADPQADVQLACVCPGCDTAWVAIFDIATVLWTEIHAWARQLLRDVHSLARAYGWRESDVVALSPTRRRMYLELVAR